MIAPYFESYTSSYVPQVTTGIHQIVSSSSPQMSLLLSSITFYSKHSFHARCLTIRYDSRFKWAMQWARKIVHSSHSTIHLPPAIHRSRLFRFCRSRFIPQSVRISMLVDSDTTHVNLDLSNFYQISVKWCYRHGDHNCSACSNTLWFPGSIYQCCVFLIK